MDQEISTSVIVDRLCLGSSATNRFSNVDFVGDKIAYSDCNSYIPIYAIFSHTLFIFENDQKVIEYSNPIINNEYMQGFRQYSQLEYYLKSTNIVRKYNFTVAGEVQSVFLHRGVVFDSNLNILLCVAIDSKYLLGTSFIQIMENPDISKFTVFKTNRFVTNPLYKNLSKNLEKTYVQKLRELGVDIIETYRIDDWLFKNSFKMPKFKNLKEMKEHLNEEIPSIWLE